jgi:hypothetical protein
MAVTGYLTSVDSYMNLQVAKSPLSVGGGEKGRQREDKREKGAITMTAPRGGGGDEGLDVVLYIIIIMPPSCVATADECRRIYRWRIRWKSWGGSDPVFPLVIPHLRTGLVIAGGG